MRALLIVALWALAHSGIASASAEQCTKDEKNKCKENGQEAPAQAGDVGAPQFGDPANSQDGVPNNISPMDNSSYDKWVVQNGFDSQFDNADSLTAGQNPYPNSPLSDGGASCAAPGAAAQAGNAFWTRPCAQ